jgi:recombination protein RecT
MNTQVVTREANPIAVLRDDLNKLSEQFRFALPVHIPPERFIRVVMTAVQNNPKLLKCTKQSLFNACMKCASDGLLPDGREAALAPFGEDEDGRGKVDQAQYLPMVAGIRKKVRNSGQLIDWNVQVVQQGDQFDYALGDNPFIHHKPAPTGGRARPVLFAYSIATFPDGSKSREVMNIDQIRDIQKKSKAKRGPWSDPVFFPEMCRKTVAKLHAKQLPMSTDLDTLLRRDDELYDFAAAKERAREAVRPPSVKAALDQFGAEPPAAPATSADAAAREDDIPTAEIEGDTADQTEQENVGSEGAHNPTSGHVEAPAAGQAPAESRDTQAGGGAEDAVRAAYERGKADKAKGHQRRAVPGEYRNHSKLAVAWDRGWSGESL